MALGNFSKSVISLTRRLTLLIFSILFSPIARLFPRNNKLWVFGANNGDSFADNPKHLFLHLSSSHDEIEAVWLSRNPQTVKSLLATGYSACATYSLRGFWYALKAGCAVLSYGITDVNLMSVTGAKKVQLWHGIPLKKIQRDVRWTAHKSFREAPLLIKPFLLLSNWCYKLESETLDYAIACSKEHADKMCSAFGIRSTNVYITGYPRNDALFRSSPLLPADVDFVDRIRARVSFKHLIMYLPTFRDSRVGKTDLLGQFGFSVTEANANLEYLDAILIMKPHHMETKLSMHDSQLSDRVFVASNADLPDVYPTLRETDILITDYSSVYFDYLLLDRPIIFAPFDLEEYISGDRELYYDYDEVTPGPKATDWPEVFHLLKQVLARDEWTGQRGTVRSRFHHYIDGNSSERVYQTIKSILAEARR
jgi:CDP-glycerol glycerophosphotransferase (TagB/SpsB family)